MTAERMCYWLLGVVFVLSLVLVFILARGYQGKVVDDLVLKNNRAAEVFFKTEQGLNYQDITWNKDFVDYWTSLGYKIKKVPQVAPQEPPKQGK